MHDKIKKIGLDLTETQLTQFEQFYHLLIEWNRFMNLTAITDYEEVILKHFTDSLMINIVDEFLELQRKGGKIIDVGTGAGFPGIPLKIAFPDNEVLLLDSLNKRLLFLNEVINKAQLHNVFTSHGRAEDCAKKSEYREKYDIAVSRAVANLAVLSEYCIPYVKLNGIFVAYKSGNVDEELESSNHAIQLLGGTIEKVYRTQLPDSDIERSLVVIRKKKNTPGKYPRKAGLPAKEPLK